MGTAYPTAAGYRNIGASTMLYIPEVWSGKLLKKFYERTALSEVTNTDYEGEIKAQGDTVWIRAVPTITIRTHRKGQTLVNEQPVATPTSLLIDQGKYWSFATDDVDTAQTDIKDYVNRWTTDASKQLTITIETAVWASVYADAHASNIGLTAGLKTASYNLGVAGTPLAFTKTNAIEVLTDCNSVLDEQSVDEEDRFIMLPPVIMNRIKKSDIKNASMTGDAISPMHNGKVGMIDNFKLFKSNLLTSGTEVVGGANKTAFYCLFGTKDAITFATQLVKNEQLRNPTGFGMLHRGLQVYGFKTVLPQALGVLYVYAA